MIEKKVIGIIPGDGIGHDVMQAARIVLDGILSHHDELQFELHDMEVGESAVDRFGSAFPDVTRDGIAGCDAVLFGAIGSPHDFVVLSGIRYGFELFANVRPLKSLDGVKVLQPGTDIVVIRENTEGLYCGIGYDDGDHHINLRVFTDRGMERIIRFSFDWAQRNFRQKITLTHKESVLRYTDARMKEIFYSIAPEYPEISAEDMEVDACAMRMVMKPDTLDVILAENANGDILSDIGGAIIGGLGFTPSANIGNRLAMFEPVHGSAPKYAGKDVVNPIATLMAMRMMFEYLGHEDIAARLQGAIGKVLIAGRIRTYDIGGTSSTSDFARSVLESMFSD